MELMALIRTLLVEDETLLRTLLRRGLEESGGFDIVGEAADGVEGMRLSESLKPDLVLLDIRLPEMDGVEMAEKLRSILPKTKIVVLSARQDPATIRQVLEHGVDHGAAAWFDALHCGEEREVIAQLSPQQLVALGRHRVDDDVAQVLPAITAIHLPQQGRTV